MTTLAVEIQHKIALTGKEAADLVGLSRSTFLGLSHEGNAPRPVQLSTGRVAWRRADLNEWLAGLEVIPVKTRDNTDS